MNVTIQILNLTLKSAGLSFAISIFLILLGYLVKVDLEDLPAKILGLVSAVVVGIFYKSLMDTSDKIRNYDFSKFNPKKKEFFTNANSEVVRESSAGMVQKLVFFILFIAFSIVINPEVSNTETLQKFIAYFLSALSLSASIVFLLDFHKVKLNLERRLRTLDDEKIVEERRKLIIEKISRSIEEFKTPHAPTEVSDIGIKLQELMKQKKDSSAEGEIEEPKNNS